MSVSQTSHLAERFRQVREFTDLIATPLSPEDCMVQSMPDASPTRWHLAHTTWFFETFLLRELSDYQVFNPEFNFLFNSYYNTIGQQFPRDQRGVISRPGLTEIKEYRCYVNQELLKRLVSEEFSTQAVRLIEIGLHHEQQHQELMLTDIKHVFSCNPLSPSYQDVPFAESTASDSQPEWIDIAAGLYEIGHQQNGFAFDNESPSHESYLHDAQIRQNLVTCGEYLEFIQKGGYEQSEHWLSLGWAAVQSQRWKAPLYWNRHDGQWHQFTLAGLVPINPDWPVTHISYYEADAFARWKGMRLATEFEWEVATRYKTPAAYDESFNFVDRLLPSGKAIHPCCSTGGLSGSVWQWTSSSYAPYPGYMTPSGAVGEYNGKFMCNQYVLRGGSVATHSTHIRPTYRNFFPPEARWQFTGIRLAR